MKKKKKFSLSGIIFFGAITLFYLVSFYFIFFTGMVRGKYDFLIFLCFLFGVALIAAGLLFLQDSIYRKKHQRVTWFGGSNRR